MALHGLFHKAIDSHERQGLRADPTQRLRQRTNNWPRGQLHSYDVLEVNPTQLPPFPLPLRRTCARTHAHSCSSTPQTPSSYRSYCSWSTHLSPPLAPHHVTTSPTSSLCHLTTSTLNPNLEPSRRPEREELTLTTSTRTSPPLAPQFPPHQLFPPSPSPRSVWRVFRVRHAAHRRARHRRGRQRADAGDRRGLGTLCHRRLPATTSRRGRAVF